MTSKLSKFFFGDKKFTKVSFERQFVQEKQAALKQSSQHRLSNDQIRQIFAPYTQKLSSIKNRDQDLSLLELFCEFIALVYDSFKKWEFQKLTSVLEISAHVFEHSFERWLDRDQSYKYFSEVVVRHSLFRPPHSVAIFSYEEMKEINQFWLNHFIRFYEEYQECLQSQLYQNIETHQLPQNIDPEEALASGSAVDRQAMSKFSNNYLSEAEQSVANQQQEINEEGNSPSS